MQSAVIRYEKRKRETYALRAKCSTIKNPAETENGSFCVYAETRKSPVIFWGSFFSPCVFLSSPLFRRRFHPSPGKTAPFFSTRIVIGSFYASPNVYWGEKSVPLVLGAFFCAGCHVYHRERCASLHTFTSSGDKTSNAS